MPGAIVTFPRAVHSNRPAADAPELTAFIDLSRFLHEHEPTAFACLARIVANTAADRGGPATALQSLRAFIKEWEED